MPGFRIDVLDASNNKVGDGPLVNIEQVTRRRSLDRIGGASFTLPGTDPKTAVVGTGRKYSLYHSRYGSLGTYSHKRQSLAVSGHAPKLQVEAQDALIELVQKNCYFRRNFNHVAVDNVVSSLIALVTGWSDGSLETGIGNTTVSYEGESVFEALDVLRDRWRKHFRLGSSDRSLDFGAFGDDSGIRLVRATAVPGEMEANDDVALVTDLEILTEGETIINRVIPVGAGAGVTQLTLEQATSTDPDYPVETGTNADGSSFYYIEDTASQGAYGLVERPFERSDIRPLTNATANLQNAANALYRAALAFLLKYKDPRTHYRVGVTKLDPARLQPGDKVRLQYRGIANQDGRAYKWVDVDADLWVMDIEETYRADGGQAVALTVATSSDRRTRDEDVLAQMVRDTKVFKTHVQPNLTHSPVGPYVKRIDSANNVTFNIRLKEEVLTVNRVICRFITNPLRSSVSASAAASGGSSTPTSGSSSISTTVSGGASTPTSGSSSISTTVSGGASTPTSGSSSITTTNSGGSSTPTSSGGGSHAHDIVLHSTLDSGSLYDVGYHKASDELRIVTSDSNQTFQSMESVSTHTHDVTIPAHDHGMAHTHDVTIPAHDHGMAHTHDVTIPTHDHGMAHTHDVTIDPHTHTITLTYGIHEDTNYPQTISVSINGTDRTTELGGTWAPSNAGVDVELDVTDYISRGQDNTVVFSCASGQGELTFLADCLLTIQAIAVT